jgi:hypothetical protein
VAVLFEFLKVENYEKDISQNNAFIRDCKMWVTHVITGLMGSFSFLDSRIILLHMLRTKGIGDWGLCFIQWNDSYDWNEDVLEHYLISLTCLLSPVEELESRMKSKLEAIAFLEEELKKLEREDWIVVHEDDLPEDASLQNSNSRLNLKTIILYESDYLGILSQFRLKNVFETLCVTFSQDSEKSLLQLISVAHHICLIVVRGIHILPKDYIDVIRHLGDHIAFVASTLGECLAKCVDDGVNLLVSKQVQSSVSIEFDAFIERLFLRLVSVKNKSAWETISKLPFDKCTVAGKIKLSESLVSLLRSGISSEVNYVCKVVQILFLVDSHPTQTSHTNSIIDWDSFSPELLRCIYHLTFVNLDTRVNFSVHGTACILDILRHKPELISCILNWIRDDIHLLDILSIRDLCAKLSWINFRARKSDLILLQGMLREPENTPKAQIAMLVLESLNWNYSAERNLGLFIPRYLHREIGIDLKFL